jgi:hypothetical protein
MKRAILKVERAKLDPLDAPLPGDEQRINPTNGTRKRLSHRPGAVLKDAILYAAQQVGEDGEGLDGLVGFLRSIAKKDPRTYASLLARVIPLQVTNNNTNEVVYRSVDEVKAELASRGILIDRVYH